MSGFSHEAAVIDILNTPPAIPQTDVFYLVGTTPSGAFASHPNEVAWWDGAAWQFANPLAGETRLVEAQEANFHWSGTAWVKVSNGLSAAEKAQMVPVGGIVMWGTGYSADGLVVV